MNIVHLLFFYRGKNLNQPEILAAWAPSVVCLLVLGGCLGTWESNFNQQTILEWFKVYVVTHCDIPITLFLC